MTRVLLVPGRNAPLKEHWQNRWAAEHPEYRWAGQPGEPSDPVRRLTDLEKAIAAGSEPAVLVAHSAGCLTVARWSWLHDGPVRGALLVAPPYLTPARLRQAEADVPPPTSTDPPASVPGPLPETPRDRLPFPSIVVASRTDPWATIEESQELADAWGARLIDIGDAGHINTASGYGPWPAGEALLAELL